MAEARQDPLLQFPRVMLDSFQHVATVVRFNDDRGTAAQPLGNQGRDVPEVEQRRDLHAIMSCCESKIIDRVMRYCEGMKLDFPDLKVTTRIDFHRAISQSIDPPA